MKIYELAPFDDCSMFFPSKGKAIAEAKGYGADDMYVDEIEIGKLTKDTACRLASHREFAISRKRVWSAPDAIQES